MDRVRLGSLLSLLCSILFAASLLTAVHPYPPGLPYVLWGLCGVLFISSVSLWFQKRWGRIIFLIGGCIYLLYCLEMLVGVGCAGTLASCYKYHLQSQPSLAVAYHFAKLVCSEESLQCYASFTCIQPVLTIFAMIVLLKPLASNNRWRGS